MGYSYAIVGAIRRLTKAPHDSHRQAFTACAAFCGEEIGACACAKVGVVGDDPAVEIIMARRGGATAFGVTTGMSTFEDWMRQPLARRPHRILNDLRELIS